MDTQKLEILINQLARVYRDMGDCANKAILGDAIVQLQGQLDTSIITHSSFSFENYTKQKGDCEDCTLREHCKPHCSTVTYECEEHICPLKFEENWA